LSDSLVGSPANAPKLDEEFDPDAWVATAMAISNDELDHLNAHENTRVNLSLRDGSDATSDDSGIGIGKELLTRTRAALGEALASEAVRWVVAHEYGHQIQRLLHIVPLTQQIKELQADSLAGIWVFRGMAPSAQNQTDYWDWIRRTNEDVNTRTSATVQVLRNALSTAGVAWNDVDAHGTVDQRVASATNGLYEWVAVTNDLVHRSRKLTSQPTAVASRGECNDPDWWRLADFAPWSTAQAQTIAVYPGSTDRDFESALNALRQGTDGGALAASVASRCGQALPAVFYGVAMETPVLRPVTEDAAIVFLKLQQSARAASERFSSGEDANSTAAIVEAVRVLDHKWRQAPASLTPEYLATLQDDRVAIDESLSATKAHESRKLLKFVLNDLEAKSHHSTRVATASETLGPVVRVTVMTTRTQQPINGYLIRCNLLRYEKEQRGQFIFNNPTPNASRALPPGYYVCWGENSGRQSPRIEEVIGDNGETAQALTLPVD
jgi:hypothetical protein